MNPKQIHEIIIDDIEKINTAGYLKMLLRDYNLHNLFSPLYENNDSVNDAIFLSAFIILAYSNKSSWITNANMQKDRRTLKLEIITSILLDSKIKISQGLESIVIKKGSSEYYEMVLTDYLNWQKNDDFNTWISLTEFKSFTNRQSIKSGDIKMNELRSLGQTLSELGAIDEQILIVRERLQKEYSSLDEALKREGRKALTSSINIDDYEERMIAKWANSFAKTHDNTPL